MEKKPQQSESRDADKYVVRFPDGMRDRIAAEAKSNNRSMNAEIVNILHNHLTVKDIHDRLVDSALEDNPTQSVPLFVAPEALSESSLPELRITLNAGDQPICWDEIHEYMRAIRKKMDVNDVVLKVTVLAGSQVSSDERAAQTQALAKKLRKKPVVKRS